MDFPKKLSKMCWQRGWSQRDLAEALGEVSKSTVSNWMTGKTDPRRSELVQLARLFGVSVDYLALEELEEPPADGLSDRQRRLLWAAETVGFEVAIKRIMNAPPGISDVPPGKTESGTEERAKGPRSRQGGRAATSVPGKRTRPGGRGPRERGKGGASKP